MSPATAVAFLAVTLAIMLAIALTAMMVCKFSRDSEGRIGVMDRIIRVMSLARLH